MKVNSKNNLAVKGYDVVAFFSGEVMLGKPTIFHKHNDVNYRFVSVNNKENFVNNPDAYLPEYGGFCAIAMSEGGESDPNPKSYKIQDGNLYLFTRMFWGIIDVKRQWNKDPDVKRQLADKEWKKMNQ